MRRRNLAAGSLAIVALLTIGGPPGIPAEAATPRERSGALTPNRRDPARTRRPPAAASLLGSPRGFEENRGQAAEKARFLWRRAGTAVFFTGPEVIVSMRGSPAETKGPRAVVSMKLIGAAKDFRMAGAGPTGELRNYYRGPDPAGWVTGAPAYRRIVLEKVYPGIDMVWYENGDGLEYDFLVAPGADPAAIRLKLEGKGKAAVDRKGDLVWKSGRISLRQHRPVVLQRRGESRRRVRGRFVLEKGNVVRFKVGRYDRSQPLVIDPVLSFSTFSGGSGEERALAIALDSDRNIYVTGETNSDDLPGAGSSSLSDPDEDGVQQPDAFVTKISLNGENRGTMFSTYLGGTREDTAHAIALSNTGTVYVAGGTESTEGFPGLVPCPPPRQDKTRGCTAGEKRDAFIGMLDGSDGSLDRAVLYGGEGFERAWGLAIGRDGSVKITGETGSYKDADEPPSADLFVPNAYDDSCGGEDGCPGGGPAPSDAFLAVFKPDLSDLVYGTYLGGDGGDMGMAIASDPLSDDTYIWAMLNSDGILIKFNLNRGIQSDPENVLLWSKRLKGAEPSTTTDYATVGASLALDPGGIVYVTGSTKGLDEDLRQGFQPAHPFPGRKVGFLVKLAPSGSQLYGTYLGGKVPPAFSSDTATSVAVDSSGRTYVVGTTSTEDFPTKFPIQRAHSNPCTGSGVDCLDAFVAFIDTGEPGPDSLLYSTYLGGAAAEDSASGVAVDLSGNAYLSGWTRRASTFPVTPDAFQHQLKGTGDAFVAKIVPLTITDVVPKSGLTCGGEKVRINGFGLRETTHVKFGGAAVIPERVADDEVIATAPAAGPGPVRVWPATPDVPDPPDPARHLLSQANLESIFTYIPATAPCVSAPPPPPGGSPSRGTTDPAQPKVNPATGNQITPRVPGPPTTGGGATPASLLSSQSSPAPPVPGGSAPPLVTTQALGAQPAPGAQVPSSVPAGASAAPPQAAAGAGAERREAPVPAPKFFFVPQAERAPGPGWAAGMALLVCGIAVLLRTAWSTGAGRTEEACRPAPRFAL